MRSTDSEEKKPAETYADKMGVSRVDIGEVPALIKKCYQLRDSAVLCLVGHAGIGKTDVYHQVGKDLAKELNSPFEVRISSTSSKLPEDFSGIPVPCHQTKSVDFYRMAELPVEGKGILFFDEINRCDPDTLKPIVGVLSSFETRNWKKPEGWMLGAAMNPDEDFYNVIKLEPALRRRLVMVEVTTSAASFLKWAETHNIHPAVFDYIRKNKDAIFDMTALENDKVFANPSGYEKVSNLLKSLVRKDEINTYFALMSGLLGKAHAAGIRKEFDKITELLDPIDVFTDYVSAGKSVRKTLKAGRLDVIGSLMGGITVLLERKVAEQDDFLTSAEGKKALTNIGLFYVDLPSDLGTVLVNQLTNLKKPANFMDLLTRIPEVHAKMSELRKLLATA